MFCSISQDNWNVIQKALRLRNLCDELEIKKKIIGIESTFVNESHRRQVHQVKIAISERQKLI